MKNVDKTSLSNKAVKAVRTFGTTLLVMSASMIVVALAIVLMAFTVVPGMIEHTRDINRQFFERSCQRRGGEIVGDICRGWPVVAGVSPDGEEFLLVPDSGPYMTFDTFYVFLFIRGWPMVTDEDRLATRRAQQMAQFFGYLGYYGEGDGDASRSVTPQILLQLALGTLGAIFGWKIRRVKMSAKSVGVTAAAVIIFGVVILLTGGGLGLFGLIAVIFAIFVLPKLGNYDRALKQGVFTEHKAGWV